MAVSVGKRKSGEIVRVEGKWIGDTIGSRDLNLGCGVMSVLDHNITICGIGVIKGDTSVAVCSSH